ncbi:MAG: hypothetical protein KBA51_01740 [Kiritimatiellae bacterium]|nr:hypothetical protein [Kiritimatiellia bacterium]
MKRVLRGSSAYHPGTRPRVVYRHRHARLKAWVFWISVAGLSGVLVYAWWAHRHNPSKVLPLDERRLDELGPQK